MHLVLPTAVGIDDGTSARDLGQAPGDVVFLSAADTDLALMAAAVADRSEDVSFVLTNTLALGHPASVDLYVERTLAKAKLIVLRLLGGRGYWPYGVDALRREALAQRIPFACLSAEGGFDPALAALGTLDLERSERLWRYFKEGGPDNARGAVAFCRQLIGVGGEPPAPRPMPAAGVYREPRGGGRPACALIFYRALAQAGDTAPVDALSDALAARGLDPLAIHVTSLKDETSRALLQSAFAAHAPDVVLTATAFAAGADAVPGDAPVLQIAFAGVDEQGWRASPRGLLPRDLAMHVVLPEVDGRIFAGVAAVKTQRAPSEPARYAPLEETIAAIADRAAAWVHLRRAQPGERRIGIVVSNYPSRDGRIANGVGLDAAGSLVDLISWMRNSGYYIDNTPNNSTSLMRLLWSAPTNEPGSAMREGGVSWPIADYREALACLPLAFAGAIEARWGPPERDPFAVDGALRLAIHRFGNLAIAIQPSRGYELDPDAAHHDPDLVPPHRYVACYLFLRKAFGAHALVHMGKHGNLEWLPGKAAGLSMACAPQALIGAVPLMYPFIVNDPGEGMQAKRRTAGVVIDHLTPPLARAGLGPDFERLEALIDEAALAADLDPRRAAQLHADILAHARASGLDREAGIGADEAAPDMLRRLDARLCDLKEMQIRDGLHRLGTSPAGRPRAELIAAIARLPRPGGGPADEGLTRALAADLRLGGFDPLARDFAADWSGPRPDVLSRRGAGPWRSAGDTVERLEALALALVEGELECPADWPATKAVLGWIEHRLAPALDASGPAEESATLLALAGRRIAPGPAGAPTRGRPEVLATGRNFYAVDVRAIPTEAAWKVGRATAEALVMHHYEQEGAFPAALAISAWGTSNMRTGGEDIAQVLALLGAKPVWESGSGRVTGVEILPLSALGRPRIDVTLRISGMFRDAFPLQIDLIDTAVRTVAALDEPAEANRLAAQAKAETRDLVASGLAADAAEQRAARRIFGPKPGAYGAGVQAFIDGVPWQDRAELARAYASWSGYVYGGGEEGSADPAALKRRLGGVELVAQAQDNREHDILDSDDYYQFMGGLAAAVEAERGVAPPVVHLDTSRPQAPLARALSDEIGRVVYGRATNPRWLAGVMRHGAKGAFEIAATVDYLFGFAATTNAVAGRHFDRLFEAYLADAAVRDFMLHANPAALAETAARFEEALRRGLWTPARNDVAPRLGEIAALAAQARSAAAI